jgi:hypothetical protein
MMLSAASSAAAIGETNALLVAIPFVPNVGSRLPACAYAALPPSANSPEATHTINSHLEFILFPLSVCPNINLSRHQYVND